MFIIPEHNIFQGNQKSHTADLDGLVVQYIFDRNFLKNYERKYATDLSARPSNLNCLGFSKIVSLSCIAMR